MIQEVNEDLIYPQTEGNLLHQHTGVQHDLWVLHTAPRPPDEEHYEIIIFGEDNVCALKAAGFNINKDYFS